jgi:neuron navigator 2
VSVGSSFHRRSSNSSSLPHDARSAGLKYLPVLTRHISCESVNSLNSQSSSCSMGSQQSASLFSEKKKKKKNWIRSSFSKAFSRKKNKPGSVGEPDSLSLQSDTSNNEPLAIDSQTNTPLKNSPPEGSHAFPDSNEGELEKRLHEADMELTELRLEQLASIQNIDHLQEKINLLEQQVATLKAENKSLQRLLLHQGTSPSTPATSLALQKRGSLLRSSSPGTPLPSSYSVDGLSKLTIPTPHEMSSPKLLQRFSLVDAMASDASYEQLRRICVYVLERGCELHGRKGNGDSEEETNDKTSRQIGVLMLSEQASWLELDLQIGNLFVEHIHNLDPETGLGLDVKSIASYRLGSQERIPSQFNVYFSSNLNGFINDDLTVKVTFLNCVIWHSQI